MSDYTNPNIHRGQGITGRGLLIAVAVLVAFIFALAYLGASTVPEGSLESGATGAELGADGVITPAAPVESNPAAVE
ncbi:hypothetical protein [Pseudosulfitobacter sp. SM2401]|uniref:hypothetical protein n=1 Tax=Pseudosulfitobacter sp. SM2401 TaxID=3350098 RepID=UPI0036F44CAE